MWKAQISKGISSLLLSICKPLKHALYSAQKTLLHSCICKQKINKLAIITCILEKREKNAAARAVTDRHSNYSNPRCVCMPRVNDRQTDTHKEIGKKGGTTHFFEKGDIFPPPLFLPVMTTSYHSVCKTNLIARTIYIFLWCLPTFSVPATKDTKTQTDKGATISLGTYVYRGLTISAQPT